MMSIIRKCKNCGNELINNRRKNYCNDCYTKKCVVCGKVFIGQSVRTKYCSNKCRLSVAWFKKSVPDGSKYLDICRGYIKIRVNKKWVLEHRYLMEQALGRKLKSTEQVHHLNKDRADNRIENLQMVQRTHHYSDIECPYCQKTFKIK